MKLSLISEPPEKLKTECLAIGLFQEEPLPADVRKLDSALNGAINSLLKNKDFKGELNETYIFPSLGKLGAKRVLLVGLGKKNEFSFDMARQAAASSAQAVRKLNLTSYTTLVFGTGVKGPTSELVHALSEGAVLGAYAFDTFKTENKDKKKPLESVDIFYPDKKEAQKLRESAESGKNLAEIVNHCRELANLPANIATPTYLANEAEKFGKKYGFKVTVYDKAGLVKLGFNALLAVNSGSAQEPRFIVLEYKPKSISSAPLCLVGKTITFDSGGLNIKTSDYMNNMKYDKCGGISVLGVIAAAAALKIPSHLVGLMPATENMPSGSAYKVGDIYKTYNGKTIEIGNTDAEGRVILSDALGYTKEFKPRAVIDLATLTGACVVALGVVAAGLMGTDSKLISKLKEAAEHSGERVWELPMYEEYFEQIKSDVADVKNIGDGNAGAITAAKFLQKFLPEGVPWAHLDIAGVAWTEKGKYKPYVGKGATGYGIRLLIELLKNWK